MSIAKEFEEFISRGNVVDLAVGVIMGAAFGTVVSSLVNDVMMPPIGKVIGGVNFSQLKIDLGGPLLGPDGKPELDKAGNVVQAAIYYGKFIQTIISFLIISFCVFLMVKAVNQLKRPKPDAIPEPTLTEKLLAEIRDELRKK